MNGVRKILEKKNIFLLFSLLFFCATQISLGIQAVLPLLESISHGHSHQSLAHHHMIHEDQDGYSLENLNPYSTIHTHTHSHCESEENHQHEHKHLNFSQSDQNPFFVNLSTDFHHEYFQDLRFDFLNQKYSFENKKNLFRPPIV